MDLLIRLFQVGLICLVFATGTKASSYLEGGTSAVCWKTPLGGSSTEVSCTNLAKLKFSIPPPEKWTETESVDIAYDYEILFTKPLGQNKSVEHWDIPHTNIHSCFSNSGACTPFISNTPGLSTHTSAMKQQLVNNRGLVKLKFELEKGKYTVIAHVRFFDKVTGDKYDVANGVKADVMESNNITVYVIVGIGAIVFLVGLIYGVRSVIRQNNKQLLAKIEPSQDKVTSSDDYTVCEWKCPTGKKYHAFLSHKKSHSKNGTIANQVAMSINDALQSRGFSTFYDIDKLKNITKENLAEHVKSSSVLLLLLNEETLESEWVTHEINIAKENGVPIIPVVNTDLYVLKDVVDHVIGRGYDYCVKKQCINYSTQHRKHVRNMISSMVNAAVQKEITEIHGKRRKSMFSGRIGSMFLGGNKNNEDKYRISSVIQDRRRHEAKKISFATHQSNKQTPTSEE